MVAFQCFCHQTTQPFANKTFAAFYFTFLTMKPLGNFKIDMPILFQILFLNEANKKLSCNLFKTLFNKINIF